MFLVKTIEETMDLLKENFSDYQLKSKKILLENALNFEEEMFPGISSIDLYSLTNQESTWSPDNIPYNRSTYLPYESNYKQKNYDRSPSIYGTMGAPGNYWEDNGFYDRWKPKPKWKDYKNEKK